MEEPNLSFITKLSNGDKAFEEKIFGVINKEFPGEKEKYFLSIKSKNYKKAAEDVHKLKHKISILGLQKSYDLAEKYEDNLKNTSEVFREEFESILKNITKYLQENH
ncbi:Hpt domain-containing protein [uncultured Aquimarina sp.]|uniref:Hpt domain-containing protein n=1 Tax=uncultured Aquimarina sp. TaxID=575652 RepID=UPI0026246CD5|nr:Hpt domain-containing protein [uncultured Aquimarina sp.]